MLIKNQPNYISKCKIVRKLLLEKSCFFKSKFTKLIYNMGRGEGGGGRGGREGGLGHSRLGEGDGGIIKIFFITRRGG